MFAYFLVSWVLKCALKDDLVKSIMNENYSWVHYDSPDLKRDLMNWKHPVCL
jgi:hypothetical protein